MDSNSLYYSLDLVSGIGYTLNAEQRAALEISLVLLKKNYKFNRVMFCGKILGLNRDYFIAQGKGEDEMTCKKYLYSFDCMDWKQLLPVTDALIEKVSKAARGRFRGDPTHRYEHTEYVKRQAEGDETVEEEVLEFKVIEEERLAVTIHQIDQEVSVVPRGAFIKRPDGRVQTNRSFEGLSHSEAARLNNFFHFTEPKNVKKRPLLETSDWDPSIDFLEPISEDIPKGSWSLQFEQGSKVCVLRSLLWLGLSFFHVPETPQHGYVYIGDGLKNMYLPFMI